jgi:hypothetical protein
MSIEPSRAPAVRQPLAGGSHRLDSLPTLAPKKHATMGHPATDSRLRYCRGPVADLLNLHALDKTIAERVHMMDDGISEEVACGIAHHLMNFNQGAVGLAGLDLQRIDMGIEDGPLADPVGADFLVSVDTAAFDAVRAEPESICPC